MDEVTVSAAFQPKQPKQSSQEKKAETTSRVAREIVDAEVAKRQAKTERLRAARLAQAEDEPADARAQKKAPSTPARMKRQRRK